jgi:phosphoribosylformylglycinamidine synthase
MAELGLIYPLHKKRPKLLHNKSQKFESGYINVVIPDNKSVMLGNMSGMELGIWVAHAEGRFSLPTLKKDNVALNSQKHISCKSMDQV